MTVSMPTLIFSGGTLDGVRERDMNKARVHAWSQSEINGDIGVSDGLSEEAVDIPE